MSQDLGGSDAHSHLPSLHGEQMGSEAGEESKVLPGKGYGKKRERRERSQVEASAISLHNQLLL